MTTDRQVPAATPAGSAGAAEQGRARARLFGLLLLALVVVSELPLPFRLAGLAFGVGTVWVGILALIGMGRMRRSGGKPRGQIAVSAGLGLAGVLMFALFAQALFYPIVADLERCLGAANTRTAQKACEDASNERRDDLIERLQLTR